VLPSMNRDHSPVRALKTVAARRYCNHATIATLKTMPTSRDCGHTCIRALYCFLLRANAIVRLKPMAAPQFTSSGGSRPRSAREGLAFTRLRK
jgi:hypothetical protein